MPSDQALEFLRHNPTDVPVVAIFEASGKNPRCHRLTSVLLWGQHGGACHLDLTLASSEVEVARGMLKAYPLVLYDAARCLAWLMTFGLSPAVAADPKLACFVLDPNGALDIQSIAKKRLSKELRELGGEPVEAGVLVREPDELLGAPLREMAMVVAEVFEQVRDLPAWAEPVYRSELELVATISAMEETGIGVDECALRKVVRGLEEKVTRLEANLNSIASGSQGGLGT